jgi:adenosylcobinamide-GDP ribazoletransferase
MTMMEAFRGLVTAFRTLTVLPVPGKDALRFSTALYWFPLVGLFLGALQAFCAYAAASTEWHELAGFAAVLAGVLLTRGLHADGLADLADGFWGGKDRQAVLRIMKDPNVGSFGALSLVLVFLLKWIAAVKLVDMHAYGTIASGVLLARWVQVLLASSMPYARSEGGTAQAFVAGAGRSHLVLTSLSSTALLLLLLQADLRLAGVALAAAVMSALATGLIARRKAGGVTGDVLGAVSELTETAVWIGCAIIGR